MCLLVASSFCIDVVHILALVRERKVDWENLLGGTGTKEILPIKIKRQLMSNEDFIQYSFLPELSKLCKEKYDIAYKQALLRPNENDFPTLCHNDIMNQVFVLYCV